MAVLSFENKLNNPLHPYTRIVSAGKESTELYPMAHGKLSQALKEGHHTMNLVLGTFVECVDEAYDGAVTEVLDDSLEQLVEYLNAPLMLSQVVQTGKSEGVESGLKIRQLLEELDQERPIHTER